MRVESFLDIIYKRNYVPHRKKDFTIKELDKILEDGIIILN